MHNIIFVFFVSLPMLLSVPHKAIAGSDNKILTVLYAQRDAWNKGDLVGYMQGYWQSDSLQFVSKKGITRGWQATLDMYLKSYPNKVSMGYLSFDELQIRYIGKEDAIVIGRWQLKRETDQIGGYFTLQMRRINKEWKIIVDHTS